MQQHRIEQLTFDMHLGQVEGAPLQQRVSEFCRTRLELVLERAMADCPPQAPLVFRRIVLDLGLIPVSLLEGMLAERIGHRLRDLLARHLAGLPMPATVLAEPLAQAPLAAAAPLSARAPAHAHIVAGEQAALEQLAQLLQHGHHRAGAVLDASQLLMQLSISAPEGLTAMLRHVGLLQPARKRLASQFGQPVFERIVHLLEPAHAVLVIACAHEIDGIHRKTRLLPQDARGLQRAVWEFILVYLLVERGSRFNARAFTASLLQQMAGRYQIAYADLLALLIGSVGQVALPFSARSSLPILLLDLQNQIAAPAADAETQLEHAQRQLREAAAFLEFGVFAGVSRPVAQQRDLLLSELLQQQPDTMRLLLRRLGQRQAVRRRLAGQVAEPVLHALVQLLEPVHAASMLLHMRGIRSMHAYQALVPQDVAGFGRVLWQLLLDYLLARRGSLFNQRSYVHSLLLGMAGRYSMRYRDLLTLVLSHLSIPAGGTVRADSLAGILLSLSDQAWLGRMEDTSLHPPVLARLLDAKDAAALASRLDSMDDAAITSLLREIGPDSDWWMHAAARLPQPVLLRLLAIAGRRLGSFVTDARRALQMLLAPYVGGGAATNTTVSAYLLAALLQPAGQGALPVGQPRAVQLLRSMLSATCARYGLSYRQQLMVLAAHPVQGAVWRGACTILLAELVPAAAAGAAQPETASAGTRALYYLRHGTLPTIKGAASRPDVRALLRDPAHAAAMLSAADLRPDMIRRLLAHAPRARLLALLAALCPGAVTILTAFLEGSAVLAAAGIGAGAGLRRAEVEALHWQLLLETLLDRHAARPPVAELLLELAAQLARRLGVSRADYGRAWAAALASQPVAPQAAAVLAQTLGQSIGDTPPETVMRPAVVTQAPGVGWPLLALMPEQPAAGLAALQTYLQFGTLPAEAGSRGRGQQLQAHFASALQSQGADLRQMLLQAAGNAVQRAQLASRAPLMLQQSVLQLLLGTASLHCRRAMEVLLQLPGSPWRAAELTACLLAVLHRQQGRRFDPARFLLEVLASRPDLPESIVTLTLQRLRHTFDGRQDGGWRRHIERVGHSMARLQHIPAPTPAPVAAAEMADAAAPWRLPEAAAELPAGAVYYVANAGIVLLWPFLQHYFDALGMLNGRDFSSPQQQSRAVYLLQYLASGMAIAEEPELLLSKLLCGMDGGAALEAEAMAEAAQLGDEVTALSGQLLNSVTQRWPKLKNTSVRVLRESFLMREGRLSLRADGWVLNVSSGPFDPLLQSLPWGLSMVRLPWMAQVLWVEWKR